jgi:predicted RNase H-like HicB family nuclease
MYSLVRVTKERYPREVARAVSSGELASAKPGVEKARPETKSLMASVEERMVVSAAQERLMRYRILISQDEDGVFVAECPSLPGCISQGTTRELALQNMQDAIKGYLESLKKHGDPVPPSIAEEIIEVNV